MEGFPQRLLPLRAIAAISPPPHNPATNPSEFVRQTVARLALLPPPDGRIYLRLQ